MQMLNGRVGTEGQKLLPEIFWEKKAQCLVVVGLVCIIYQEKRRRF